MPDTELAKRLEGVIRNSDDPVARQVCREAAAALSAARAEAFAQAIKLFDPRWDYFGGTVIEKLRALAAGQGGENGAHDND